MEAGEGQKRASQLACCMPQSTLSCPLTSTHVQGLCTHELTHRPEKSLINGIQHMILWLHSDENQGTRSTKCALSFETGSSPELSASHPHSAGQRWSQLPVSHTIRKGDCSGQSDTQPAHRSHGSGSHETCLSLRTVAVSTACHRRFLVTMAVLAPWQKLFVRKKKKGIPSGPTLHI